jgi:hypothetical protein
MMMMPAVLTSRTDKMKSETETQVDKIGIGSDEFMERLSPRQRARRIFDSLSKRCRCEGEGEDGELRCPWHSPEDIVCFNCGGGSDEQDEECNCSSHETIGYVDAVRRGWVDWVPAPLSSKDNDNKKGRRRQEGKQQQSKRCSRRWLQMQCDSLERRAASLEGSLEDVEYRELYLNLLTTQERREVFDSATKRRVRKMLEWLDRTRSIEVVFESESSNGGG